MDLNPKDIPVYGGSFRNNTLTLNRSKYDFQKHEYVMASRDDVPRVVYRKWPRFDMSEAYNHIHKEMPAYCDIPQLIYDRKASIDYQPQEGNHRLKMQVLDIDKIYYGEKNEFLRGVNGETFAYR